MSKSHRDQIAECQRLIDEERAKVQALGDNITLKQQAESSAIVEDLIKLQAATITDGAKPCPKCGALPHGMVHPMPVKGETRNVYEIGCLPCADVRSIDLLPELAVERWNDEKFEAPSKGPGVRLAGEEKVAT